MNKNLERDELRLEKRLKTATDHINVYSTSLMTLLNKGIGLTVEQKEFLKKLKDNKRILEKEYKAITGAREAENLRSLEHDLSLLMAQKNPSPIKTTAPTAPTTIASLRKASHAAPTMPAPTMPAPKIPSPIKTTAPTASLAPKIPSPKKAAPTQKWTSAERKKYFNNLNLPSLYPKISPIKKKHEEPYQNPVKSLYPSIGGKRKSMKRKSIKRKSIKKRKSIRR